MAAADSTTTIAPLLSQRQNSYSAEAETSKASSPLDETIEGCIGNMGWIQCLQATIVVSLAWFFDAQQTFISVFTDAYPTWHCATSHPPLLDMNEYYNASSCTSTVANVCQLSNNSWVWDSPPHSSTVSDWSLECAGSIITGLPASAFFLGCLVGGFVLAPLADNTSLGRKNLLLSSCLLMSVAGLLSAVSPNVWVYSALRFLSGFGRAQIGTCALVLSSELVGKRWRGRVGIFGFICFALGFLSLPGVAYLSRGSSWRIIYLLTCIPTAFYCLLVYLFVRESPRWLFVRGRKEEFVATLTSTAPQTERDSLVLKLNAVMDGREENHCSSRDDSKKHDFYSAVKILVAKKWALRRLAAIMALGFGIGMMYYGMPLGVGNLVAGNLYTSVTLNALSELPASLVTFFLIDRLNRRSALFGFTILSGTSSLTLCAIIVAGTGNGHGHESVLKIGLELVSFFSACTAFDLLLIYTLELFPTCVRNSATSMARQAVVLGSVFSPVLIAAGRMNEGLVSYGVFGMMIGLCGLFVGCLPETKGGAFCDTMDEEDDKD